MKKTVPVCKKTLYLIFTLVIICILFSGFAFSQKLSPESQGWDKYYTTSPDIPNCNPGQLKDETKTNFLTDLNLVRAIHHLSPVSYDVADDPYTIKAALMVTANNPQSFSPNSSWQCFDASGAVIFPQTLIYELYFNDANLDITPEDALIFGLISDNDTYQGAYVTSNRRALLNPFLKGISFGRSDGKPNVASQYTYSSTQVIYFMFNDQSTSDFQGDFIAYPFENYPISYVDKNFFLSFQVIYDKSNWRNNNNVDYTNITLVMQDDQGNPVAVSNANADNVAFYVGGLPNCLHWKATGLVDHKRYTVNITNVKVNGVAQNYSYWFELNNKNLPAPAMPNLQLPENTEQYAGRNPQLVWDSIPNAGGYWLIVSKANDFATDTIVNEKNLTTRTYDLTNLDVNTTFYWKVQAFNEGGTSSFSPVWSFRSGILAPEAPVLSSPADKAQYVGIKPTLRWALASRSDFYHLQVSKTQDFSSDVIVDKSDSKLLFYALSDLELNAVYYWRVQGTNEGGAGPWSSVWSFTANIQTPNVPVLNLPLNNSQGIEVNPIVQWSASDRADYYHIMVAKTNDFSSGVAVDRTNINITTYPLPELDANVTYYWRVEAINDGGSGGWSNVWNFTTALSVPGKPDLVYPPAGQQDVPINPKLIWNRATNASSYKIQIANTNFFNPEDIILNVPSVTDTTYNVAIGVLDSNKQYFWQITSTNSLGTGASIINRFRTGTGIIAVHEIYDINQDDGLYMQNYPNPFSERTSIEFKIINPGYVSLKLYNSLGVQVSTILSEFLKQGNYSIEFVNNGLPDGIYYYQLSMPGMVKTGTMSIMK